MRILGIALSQYMQDYDGVFPIQGAWEDTLPKKYPEIYCPAAKPKLAEVKKTGFYGYAFNDSLLNWPQSRMDYPQTTVMAFESAAGVLSASSPKPFPGIDPDELALEKGWLRHRGGSHYLFADGHVCWYREKDVRGVDDYDGNDGVRPTFSTLPGIKQTRQAR